MSIKFNEDDARCVIDRMLGMIQQQLGTDSVLVCPSGKGIITLDKVNSRLNNLLVEYKSTTSVEVIAATVDVDPKTALSQLKHLQSTQPSSLHIDGKDVITTAQLDDYGKILVGLLEQTKYSESRNVVLNNEAVNQTVLDKIIERIDNPKVLTVADFFVLETDFIAVRQQLYDHLNAISEPIEIASVNIEHKLFDNTRIRANIVGTISQEISRGTVKGQLLESLFVPSGFLSTKRAELNQEGVTSKDQYGLVESHLTTEGTPYTVTEKLIVLQSHVDAVANESQQKLREAGFVELANAQLPLEVVVPVFESKLAAEEAKCVSPDGLFVSPALVNRASKAVESAFADKHARSQAQTFYEHHRDAVLPAEASKLSGFVSTTAPLLAAIQERDMVAFLAQEFPELPGAVHQYLSEVQYKVQGIYENTFLKRVKSLYSADKLEHYAYLMVLLRGVLEIATHDKKLAKKLYAQFPVKPTITAEKPMGAMETSLAAAINKITDHGDLDYVLANEQNVVLRQLERQLKDANDGPTVLELATRIVHGKMLRYEKQYGVLKYTDDSTKKTTKAVLKTLEKQVDVRELSKLRDAVKKHQCTEEVVSRAKNVALGAFR
ncbi:hypothetical protein D0Z00_003158 [Geotrichum galactomycetum]|uniref:Uncharacterized protein n=1 Tax=Geotrichum galactomycetum TaxID=27317 RepID=A0ACB6V233_9ASCO|nr:hypothetical protein D0Z00_003158 [Geotrichum candidum]